MCPPPPLPGGRIPEAVPNPAGHRNGWRSGPVSYTHLTLATLIVGLPASIFACRKMSVGAFAGNVVPYKFPVLEMGLFILVLFGMELILSVWTIRRQKKQSLIEQMRVME